MQIVTRNQARAIANNNEYRRNIEREYFIHDIVSIVTILFIEISMHYYLHMTINIGITDRIEHDGRIINRFKSFFANTANYLNLSIIDFIFIITHFLTMIGISISMFTRRRQWGFMLYFNDVRKTD